MRLPLKHTLQNGDRVFLDRTAPHEVEQVQTLFNQILLEGATYPQEQPLDATAFHAYWLEHDSFVVRGRMCQPTLDLSILAAFFIRPNFPGRCRHICNAGFIVAQPMRRLGIGRFMGEAMLVLARQLGYRAVMFNLVFATNQPSLQLWNSLGFREIGRIPNAARLDHDRFTDAIMLYREL